MRIGFAVAKKAHGFEHRVPCTRQLPWLAVSVQIPPPPLKYLAHIEYKNRLFKDNFKWWFEPGSYLQTCDIPGTYVLLIVCTVSPSLHPSLGPQRFHFILQKLLWEKKQPQRSVKLTPLFRTPWDQKRVLVREVSSFELEGFCCSECACWRMSGYHISLKKNSWRWVRYCLKIQWLGIFT